MLTEFCNTDQAMQILQCSRTTLNRYRKQGRLLAGIHWGKNPSGFVVYFRPLLEHLVICGGDANSLDHQRFIQQWLENRPENQNRKRGRKAS